MKLFLASQATHPESIEKIWEFVGGAFENKKIVYISTAGNGKIPGIWKESRTMKSLQFLDAQLEVVELESCTHQDVIPLIEDADILWVGGGMTAYLLYWMRRSELDKNLPRFFENGMVYVGSSTGSMACSTTQDDTLGFPQLLSYMHIIQCK